MRVTDENGVEYEVTYDADRDLYVYMKVFKPWQEQAAVEESADGTGHAVPQASSAA